MRLPAFLQDFFYWLWPPDLHEVYEVLAIMGEVFADHELYSDKSFAFGRYVFPLRLASKPVVIGGSLLVEIATDLLPRGVFIDQLQDPRLITALKTALRRNVEIRTSETRANPQDLLFEVGKLTKSRFLFSRTPVATGQPFFYKVELNSGVLRGIPRMVDFEQLPEPPHREGLFLPLGQVGVDQYEVFDLAERVSMLVAGATGTGKTTYVRGVIYYILNHYPSEDVYVWLGDFKLANTDYDMFRSVPNVGFAKNAKEFLQFIYDENERRSTLLRITGCKNIQEYNALSDYDRALKIGLNRVRDKRGKLEDYRALPRILAVNDEVTVFNLQLGFDGQPIDFDNRPKNFKQNIEYYQMVYASQLATTRCTGIYHAIATQRPDTDVLPGIFKANVPIRICFSVASEINGKVVFDDGEFAKFPVQLGCRGRAFCLIDDRFFEFQGVYA